MTRSIRHALGGRPRLAAGAIATLAAVTAMAAPATAAHAAPAQPSAVVPASSIADCQAIKATAAGKPLCFWVGPNWTGYMGNYAGSQTYWGNWAQSQCLPSHTWNDCASALYNAGSYVAVVWKDAGHNSGEHGCVAPGTAGQHPDLADYRWPDGSPVDNSISSNSWVASGCP